MNWKGASIKEKQVSRQKLFQLLFWNWTFGSKKIRSASEKGRKYLLCCCNLIVLSLMLRTSKHPLAIELRIY